MGVIWDECGPRTNLYDKVIVDALDTINETLVEIKAILDAIERNR
jgi:hypothetical protein